MKNKESILIGLLVIVIVVGGFVFFKQEKALNELTETVDEVVKQEVIDQEEKEAEDLEFKKALEEREKIDGELGKTLAKFAFNIEVDGESQEAKVLVTNSKYTKHDIRYDLYLTDDSQNTEKLLCSIEEIKPGEKVEYVKLNETLEPGVYKGHASVCDNQEGNLEVCSFLDSFSQKIAIVVK